MEASPPYKPEVPPGFDLTLKLTFVGGLVALVLYGVSASIFFNCLQVIVPQVFGKRARHTPIIKKIQLFYMCSLFVCGSIFVACDSATTVISTVDYPLFPGGPLGWAFANYNHPLVILANVSYVVSTWLADGFMLYRCVVLYSGMLYVVVVPGLTYLVSIATGILLVVSSSQPENSLFSNVNFGLAYFATTASLNLLISCIIAGRLIFHRLKMQKIMSFDSTSLRSYVSLTTILIESSAIYALFFLLFIIPFSLNHPVAKFFLPLLAQIQVICPLLVTYRLTRERAWTKTTSQGISASIGRLEFDRKDHTTAHAESNPSTYKLQGLSTTDTSRTHLPKASDITPV